MRNLKLNFEFESIGVFRVKAVPSLEWKRQMMRTATFVSPLFPGALGDFLFISKTEWFLVVPVQVLL